MKKFKTLRQAFGINEYELIDFPKKISNVQISRILMEMKWGARGVFRMALKL